MILLGQVNVHGLEVIETTRRVGISGRELRGLALKALDCRDVGLLLPGRERPPVFRVAHGILASADTFYISSFATREYVMCRG